MSSIKTTYFFYKHFEFEIIGFGHVYNSLLYVIVFVIILMFWVCWITAYIHYVEDNYITVI